MKKTEFQTLKMLIDGAQKIRVILICDFSRTAYEGAASDAPSMDWEVLSIYMKDGYLMIEVC